MKTPAAGLLLAVLAALSSRALAQDPASVAHDASDQCISIYVRGGVPNSDLIKQICHGGQLTDSLLVATHKFAAVYEGLVPFVARAFDVAEENICGRVGCMTQDKQVAIVLVAEGLPEVLRWDFGTQTLFTVSGGFIDYAIRPSGYVVDDLLDRSQGRDGTQRIDRWLRGLLPAQGLPCDTPAFWLPDEPLSTSDEQRVNAHAVATVSALSFLFTHELAHWRSPDNRCRAPLGADTVAIEMACDSIALVRGMRRTAVMPLATVVGLHGLGAWEALKGPRIAAFNARRLNAAPTLRIAAPARVWLDRSEYLVGLWRRVCKGWSNSGGGCPITDADSDLLAVVKRTPVPRECVERSRSQ